MSTKPALCSCGPGGFKVHGEKWVVIERRGDHQASRLKCLRCGWKFWVKRNYVHKLPDHVEAKRGKLTDADILDRLNDGTLVVHPDKPAVFAYGARGWTELKIIERDLTRSAYRFVTICSGNKRKKIALHRLVWMFANRMLIPEGYDVDHITGNYGKESDTLDNLRLLESIANYRRGRPELPQSEELPF